MGSGIESVDKAELQNTFYIECMKYKRQLNINFLAGQDAIEQFSPKIFLITK